MERRAHGEIPHVRPPAEAELGRQGLEPLSLWAEAQAAEAGRGLARMFPHLHDVAFRLPEGAETVAQLQALAAAMAEPPGDATAQSGDVPAAYTYLGQFIDHDVSRIEALPGQELANLRAAAMAGPPADALGQLHNLRSGPLDLDSLYAGAPEDPPGSGRLQLGTVTGTAFSLAGKDAWNDLPRQPPGPEAETDRAALIGDPRNDENLVVAQLHVAFLRAHNALLDQLGSVAAAREALHRLYFDVIFTDFLPRIVDGAVLNRVLTQGRRVWNPEAKGLVPLEHAGAAYRFGHSMVQAQYDFNGNFGVGGRQSGGARASFHLLFTFTALSGQLGGHATLPDNWVIEWERMAVSERSRRIDTFISPALTDLRDPLGRRLEDGMQLLAERNLLRGYLLGLPTGQAVAAAIPGAQVLTGDALVAEPPPRLAAALVPFREATPLWFYVLAEAGLNGGRLGTVGSTIVVETLHALAEATGHALPAGPVEGPSGRLLDLLRLSGNLT